jgi:tRNA(Ile)-lysidine synthase
LLTIAERALTDEIDVKKGERVLVAVSGGADSMALLSVLARLAPKRGFTLVAHGVDHGLRPEANAELDLARDFAHALGVPFERTRVQVGAGGNLQARARAARYAALAHALETNGAVWIATAHHADDRAETLLLRLLRGSSPAGLAVLPTCASNRIRPLIRARKRDVLAHVTRHRVPFADDPSNQDLRFVRVRVRQQLMPLLESISPRIVEHLNNLADDLVATSAGSSDDPDALAMMESRSELPLLGAAQRAELRKMLARRSSSARVRVKGGKDVAIASDGSLVLAEAKSAHEPE